MLSDTPVDAQQADPSPATPAAQADPSAGTQNTAQPAAAEVPFHQHPRWQQMMQERNADRQLITQLRQQADQFQKWQQAQQQSGQPQPTDEQRAALAALRQLQSLDPESAKQQQRIDQLERALQGVVQHQQQVLTSQGKAQLSQMAADANLPTDPKSLAIVENAVTVYLADNPEAVARFRNHDLSVIKDAFNEFNTGFLGKLRREPLAQVAETKTAAQALPRPLRTGSAPGQAAPVKGANRADTLAQMGEKFRALLSGQG